MKCLRYMFGLGLLLAVMVGCNPHPTSSQLSSVGKGKSYQTLVGIDSLMWEQPDSALKVMMQFAASSEADSLDVFNGHYCQLLIAELLYKNRYAQSNRTEVLKAVGYFDSIVDLHGAAVQERDAFLAARAHYINGAGYYEHDSLTEACTEYLCALRMMESHFAEGEMVDKKARFMALTYNRLGELFSEQYMTEPAIACYKKSLVFCQIEPTSANGISNLLSHIASEYQIQKQYDSCEYYNKEALRLMVDTNNLIYRDLISSLAIYNYYFGKGVEPAVRDLKRMASQTMDEDERMTRFFTIGSIYYETSQFDSALVYLVPVFENKDNVVLKRDAARSLRDIYQIKGNSLKATQYAIYQAENPILEEESNWLVSQLNELFQTYLREKQEAASLRERRKAVRTALAVVLPLFVVLAAVVVILMRCRHRKRLAIQEAEAQRRLSETSQRLTEASQRLNEAAQRHDEEQRELQTKVEQATQLTREMLLQRVADIYQSNTKDRLQRILEAVDDTYPQAMAKLKEEHPELGEAERNILLLNFFHFRIKEEADLLGLSENTVAKYRSNLGKTLGKDPISDWI